MKKVFMLFDDEKTGFISIASLKKVVKELGENIDEAELNEMIQKADMDRDGLVNEEEFYNVMTRKVGKWNTEKIMDWFYELFRLNKYFYKNKTY